MVLIVQNEISESQNHKYLIQGYKDASSSRLQSHIIGAFDELEASNKARLEGYRQFIITDMQQPRKTST